MLRKRFVSLLLAMAVLCAFLCAGAAAETAEKTVKDIYSDWISAVNGNPPQGAELDEAAADAYCLQLYSYVDAASAEKLFYGGPETAAALLKPLSLALYPEANGYYWDSTLANAGALYAAVWTIVNSDEYAAQDKTRPALKELLTNGFGLPAADVGKAVDMAVDYIMEKDPEAAKAGYLQYGVTPESVTLEGSDEYIAAYQKGYALFEEGKYEEAIQAYTEALSYKENDPSASFEIAQAYISLRDFEQAKAWSIRGLSYAEEGEEKARFLRAMGFVAIEELDYELGDALYSYSLSFGDNDTAANELAYIQYVAPDTRAFTAEDAEVYLREKGIIP